MMILMSGCSAGKPEAAPPTPSPAVTAADDQPPGTLACGQAVAAVDAASLMTAGVVTAIQQAGLTADAPVADAANRLNDAYTAAVAAHGAADEPDKVAAVSAAAADMVQVCRDSGLEAVG